MKMTKAFCLGALLAAGLAPATAGETVLLDGRKSVWRTFIERGSPVVLKPDGTTRGLIPRVHFWYAAEWTGGKPAPQWNSPRPPGNWNSLDFNGEDWRQEHCPVGPDLEAKRWNHPGFSMWASGGPAGVAAVFARGRFRVLDLAAATDLTVRVEFQGAAIVYVNGKEVARAHVLEESPGHGVRAEAYPDDVYVGKGGKAIAGKAGKKSTPAQLAAYRKRVRTLSARVPASLLRRGVNVLAVEVLRAPYKEICRARPREYKKKKYCAWPPPWPHCRILEVSLTSARAGAAAGNVGRPRGVHVWQPHPWATVTGFDYGDSCESLRPVRLVGARNGSFGTRLVVGSDAGFAGLKVTVTDLAGEKGRSIPASAVLVRYAAPGEGNRFDGLLAEPPAEVPLGDYRVHRKAPVVKAAVQPVWLTVKVPPDAAPGSYAGNVTVAARGLKPAEVPLSIKVHDWRLPDPRGMVTHNNFWQSHESSAYRYKAPLWSEKHFELMGKSLELTAPLANKFCNLHLVCEAFQCGNSQSMVRWIKKGDGFEYDFTVFDRYLDLYAGKLGKPRVLLIDVCVPIHSKSRPKDGTNPIKVSRLDPATGKVEPMSQPAYGPPTGVAFWKPLLAEVRKRLEKRGWWDVALIGTASDSGPTLPEAKTFKEIWPEKGWLFSGHPNRKTVARKTAKVRCIEWVWGAGRIWLPPGASISNLNAAQKGGSYPMPWKTNTDRINLVFTRLGCGNCQLYNRSSLREYRLEPEITLQCGHNGIGRVGIDFWKLPDSRGRLRRQLTAGGQFSFNASVAWFLAPGPAGPVPTTRSEMFREGLQVREAMIYLQKALDDKKVGAGPAARIAALLTGRAGNMLRADGHREWRKNDDELFALCAEVAKAAGGK